MPAGNQSLQPLIPTVFTTMSATAYKGNIDSNSAVTGNPGGTFYVYPQTPASMSVNIDKGFTYSNIGAGLVLNNGAAAATVVLVAPGSNSYYGTIYYDTTANTFGVVYSASSATPSPVLPDQMHRVPLAVVLITSVTTTIQATNITDVRWAQFLPWGMAPGTLSANTAYNVMGALRVDINFTIGAAMTLTLNNLSEGAPVFIAATNTTGGALVFKMAATSPSGTAYVITAVSAGTLVNMITTGSSITAGTSHCFNYMNVPTLTLVGVNT